MYSLLELIHFQNDIIYTLHNVLTHDVNLSIYTIPCDFYLHILYNN